MGHILQSYFCQNDTKCMVSKGDPLFLIPSELIIWSKIFTVRIMDFLFTMVISLIARILSSSSRISNRMKYIILQHSLMLRWVLICRNIQQILMVLERFVFLRQFVSLDLKKLVNSIKLLLQSFMVDLTTIDRKLDMMKHPQCTREVLMELPNSTLCG